MHLPFRQLLFLLLLLVVREVGPELEVLDSLVYLQVGVRGVLLPLFLVDQPLARVDELDAIDHALELVVFAVFFFLNLLYVFDQLSEIQHFLELIFEVHFLHPLQCVQVLFGVLHPIELLVAVPNFFHAAQLIALSFQVANSVLALLFLEGFRLEGVLEVD